MPNPTATENIENDEQNGGNEGQQQQQQQQPDPTTQILEELKALREENKELRAQFDGFRGSFATQIQKGAVIQDDDVPTPQDEVGFQLKPYGELDFRIK